MMDQEQFKLRTKQLALRIIRLVEALPAGKAADMIGSQVLRSATSVGANYRAACRAPSTPDMIAKLNIVLQEADQTAYWLELLAESSLMPAPRLADLIREVDEIIAMTVASIETLRSATPKSEA